VEVKACQSVAAPGAGMQEPQAVSRFDRSGLALLRTGSASGFDFRDLAAFEPAIRPERHIRLAGLPVRDIHQDQYRHHHPEAYLEYVKPYIFRFV
jgi:hypothetical protein